MIVTADAILMHFYSWETSIPSARSADKTNLYRVNQKWPDIRFTVLLFLRSIATIVTHTCSLFVTTLSVWINCGNKSCSLFQPRQSTRITSWRKFLYRLQVKTRAAGALWGGESTLNGCEYRSGSIHSEWMIDTCLRNLGQPGHI